ncbi:MULTISPECIES: hypothetical protein [Streptococcus]|uniref:hypothetical protein n=1 Tax=Streptococcus TaxID=1301 RepID=UPI001C8D8F84|nr:MULTISPECIES: hypothetical protein [Streptococcus]MBY0719617.1 hypothetical protein [Streptococcus sp. 2018110]MCO8235133.1 hypothetical protein [Streptococcus suis]HEM3552282.1 hypothetical protein [Streptococcus suis]
MAYKVIRPFKDLTDPNKHDYALDETYPRDGHKPSDDFIQGLLTGSNSAGSIFLTTVEEESELPEGDKSAEEESELPEGDKPADEPVEKPKRKRTTKKAEE